MRPTLPTCAITPSRLPDLRERDWSMPLFHFDGYAEAGTQEAMVEIMRRAESGGLEALTLHELRIEYFRNQRAQRHGGGPYGENDVHDCAMAAIVDEMRKRVHARGAGVCVWSGDITSLDVDVVVNAANTSLSGGGGVDGAIHRAAGPDLLAACQAVPETASGVRCPVGDARVTPGFSLPAEWIVHTVGPVWEGGARGEAESLALAYRASLNAASGVGAESVAFPALSTGAFGYPIPQASRIAVDTVGRWLSETGASTRVVLVAFGLEIDAALRHALAG